ncbi:carbamoyltransferase [Pseudomonas sp. nanlin1]|uniref:carbamoyltransferase family protein n=1 Tax=Pseudomonas sp. nanlin1 TaxID=3040605 RepID=UPI00388E622A
MSGSNYILGISAFYHDSAAALIKDGRIICAMQEERFSRVRHDRSFPVRAIAACLSHAGISLSDLTRIAYYEDPELKFERICRCYKEQFPRGARRFAERYGSYLMRKDIKRLIKAGFKQTFGDEPYPVVYFCEHHLSHAASAFFPSPFEQAAVLCVDGIGEWVTTSAWWGESATLRPLFDIRYPHSLGLLYSAFAYYCGYTQQHGEHELMGLAPYGQPVYAEVILEQLVRVGQDGLFEINGDYFNHEEDSDTPITKAFATLFGGPRREPGMPLSQRELNLAASIQQVIERIILGLAQRVKALTGARYLCLAGSMALNCMANRKLVESGLFERIFIQPAAHDAGAALGAALQCHHASSGRPRWAGDCDDAMQGGYLGSGYDPWQVESALRRLGAHFETLDSTTLLQRTATALAEQQVVGWFQGRMEFGTHTLGNRSILGNPVNDQMHSTMNLKVRQRQSSRPFASAVLADKAQAWFALEQASPYCLVSAPLHLDQRQAVPERHGHVGLEQLHLRRSSIPAVTHVDSSSRVQTVDGQHNPLFHGLLNCFEALTGCPVLINTSLRCPGEPIVESPDDAYRCFMQTDMDCLVIGSCYLLKSAQPGANQRSRS